MSSSRSVRQMHRWVSALFTVLVALNIGSAALGGPAWVGYAALPPLVALLATGIYLFVLPYRRNPQPDIP